MTGVVWQKGQIDRATYRLTPAFISSMGVPTVYRGKGPSSTQGEKQQLPARAVVKVRPDEVLDNAVLKCSCELVWIKGYRDS